MSTIATNPIVKETKLWKYPGWRVRQYQDGHFDATDDFGLTIGCRSFKQAVWEVRQEVERGEEFARQQEDEIHAENAWLRAAEAPDNDSLGFEQWERSRGVDITDPQCGYDRELDEHGFPVGY